MFDGVSIPVAALYTRRRSGFDNLCYDVFPITQALEFVRHVTVVAHAAMHRREPERRRRLFGFLLVFNLGASWDKSAA